MSNEVRYPIALVEQLKARGVDSAATVRDGQLEIAVVKQRPTELPASISKRAKRKFQREAKPKSAPSTEPPQASN
jgi:hypothetical protein